MHWNLHMPTIKQAEYIHKLLETSQTIEGAATRVSHWGRIITVVKSRRRNELP